MSNTYHDGVDVSHKLSRLVIDQDLDMGNRNINIGSGVLKTTNLLIKEGSTSSIHIRNLSDTVYRNIHGLSAYWEATDYANTIGELTTGSGVTIDGVLLKDGLVSANLKECGVTNDTPGTPAEGDIKLDSVNHRLQFYNASAWKTLSEDP